MIYLRLFLAFLKIGAFTFGGGYAMIALVRETVLSNGWLTESEVIDFIAVAESTPGPIAVNMATFVGSSQAGILGSLCTTLGIVLPSFVIILLIAAVIKNFLKFKGVQAFLGGVRPCVVALILSTSLTMGLNVLLGFTNVNNFNGKLKINWIGILILAIIIAIALVYKHFKGKKPSAIIMIVIAAVLGMILYGLFGSEANSEAKEEDMDKVVISSVQIDSTTMKYCRFGKGSRNLVIVPGLSITSVADQGEAIAAGFDSFSEEYTVYLFDRITDVEPSCSIESMAEDTVCAMRKLGIDKASFYGASQGAMIVQVIAEEWPGMVEKAVLASSLSRANDTLRATVGEWSSLAEKHDRQALAESFADYVYGSATLEQYRDYLVSSNLNVTDEEMDRFVILARACYGFDRYEDLAKIQAPMLIICSEGDKVLTAEGSKEMAQKLGDRATLFVYGPEFGHGVYDEAPDFQTKMHEFLDVKAE